MPFDDENPPLLEIDPALNELSYAVIGAAFEVYKQLGPGLDEGLYESAMCRELTLRNIPFVRQVRFDVEYKGEKIGEKRVDLLIAEQLVVELKSVESLSPLHKAQVLTYLKISGKQLGLLINFNSAILKDGIRRIINPRGN